MRVIAKRRLGGYNVYMETGKMLGRIRKPIFQANLASIRDADRKLLYTVENKEGKFIVYEKKVQKGKGSLQYQMDDNGRAVERFRLRPPMAEKLILDTPGGKFVLIQSRTRELGLYWNGEKIGHLSHMLSLNKHLSVSKEVCPKEFLMVLFCLGDYMVHDDDVNFI